MKRLPALVVLAAAVVLAAPIASPQSFSVELGHTTGPEQPIHFPHVKHPGALRMNCLYCHYAAEKSEVANIPAVSICIGCHKMALTDRPEIQKLTAYWNAGREPPWIHVYTLPDHVKFNHMRHVKAGLACQTCHGPVQTMQVVYRYSSLKMGWCIECHRARLKDPLYPATMDCFVCHH